MFWSKSLLQDPESSLVEWFGFGVLAHCLLPRTEWTRDDRLRQPEFLGLPGRQKRGRSDPGEGKFRATISRNLLKMQAANFEKRWFLSSGRNQLGEAPDLNTFNGHDMSPDMGVPGARLAREAYLDIYAHNYNGAIPLLQKAIRVGNEDAMLYLSYCNFYGFGVP